ncbi:MAG TPA: 50S ribosomal protein L4 [Gemmatimonadaceae bacterium]
MADQTNLQAAAYTQQGTQRDAVALPGDTFDGTVNMPVMHQAVKAFLANQRQANAHTKIRKYVTGGNQKPWKQKGTGRARQGSTRAPHFVGGGTVFGPTNDRNYHQDLPKKVKALARKSALNARAREGALLVIDRFDFDAPKTARMMALVGRLELEGKKVLVLTDGVKPNVFLSARNLPTVHVMPFVDASTYHVLWSDVVLIEGPAIGQALSPVAETEAAPKAKAAKKAAKPARTPKAEAGKKKSAEKASAKKKTAARKAPAPKAAAKKAPAKKAAAKKAPAKKAAAKKAAPKKKEK